MMRRAPSAARFACCFELPRSFLRVFNGRSAEHRQRAPITDCADCASGYPISAYCPSHICPWSPGYRTMDRKGFFTSSRLGNYYRSRALAAVRSACRVSAQTRKKLCSAAVIHDSNRSPSNCSARACGGTAREGGTERSRMAGEGTGKRHPATLPAWEDTDKQRVGCQLVAGPL